MGELSSPTVQALREERARLSEGWLQAAYDLARTGAKFSSVDLWECVRPDGCTRSDERAFFQAIHRALAPLVDAGLLETTIGPPPKRGIARRLYWKPR